MIRVVSSSVYVDVKAGTVSPAGVNTTGQVKKEAS